MSEFIRITLLVAILTSAATVRAAEDRPLSLDDIVDMKSVGGNFHLAPDGYEETVLMSPDGQQVFYSVSVADWDTNQRVSTFYTVAADGGEPAEVSAVAGGSGFKYSPGGSYLSFTKETDGLEQIFVMETATGRVSQLSRHATDVFNYVWAQGESKIYFLADDVRSAVEQKRYELGANWFAVDEGPNGRIAARWRNLWRLDVSDKNETQITSEKLILDELDVSPDGKHVVVVARPDNRRNYPHTAELYAVGSSGEGLTRLTENLAPESLPLWSPDGKRIAYYAPDDKTYELTKGYLWVMDFKTKQYKKLHSQSRGDIFTLTWSADSKTLLFSEQQRMNTNVFRLDVESDTLTPITSADGSTKVLGFSADRKRMVYSHTDFQTSLDIYTSEVGDFSPVRLTRVNPWLESEIALGKSRVIRWKSSDGLEIEGILTVPKGYDSDQRVPLLVLIHGGPPQQWGNEFYYETHLYTGLGYAVLAPNVRGSSGYGDDFVRALIGDLGGGEYQDVMTGVDHVIDLGIADPDRLAIRGWSWGGVLSSWAITQTDRFKAASVGAGVMSWLSEMGPGFNWDLTEWYMEKSHWEDPEAWRKVSSLTYVQNVTTPTLIFHGDQDWYSSYNQSLIFFTGLRDIGKAPVRFISYPGRGHEEFDPWGQRARYAEEIRWMEKYVNGVDWQPPARD